MNYEEKARDLVETDLPIVESRVGEEAYKIAIQDIATALQEAHDAGLEEAASKSEAFGLLSDCRCDRHERIAKAIRALKSKGGGE